MARKRSASVDPSARVAVGRQAETMVAHWYRHALGFDLFARNLRVGPDELDLVLVRGDVARVVEVRSSAGRSSEILAWSIVGKKARRLRRAVLRLFREGVLADAAELHVDVALVLTPSAAPVVLEIWLDALPLSEDGMIW